MVGAVVGVSHSAAKGCPVPGRKQAVRSTLPSAGESPGKCAGGDARASDAEYPVDAQLKAALTQPLNACGNGQQIVQNCRRYVRNMATGAGRNTTIAARADG